MADVTFITGNQSKADFLAKYLDHPVAHQKVDLDEIQSLDLRRITEHKARQAYEIIKAPVLVEDIGLEFHALGRLPGPFVKWFIEDMGLEGMCRMLEGYNDRAATARICFAYYDGAQVELFEGSIQGTIADSPRGADGFGWNPIFIPDGADKTFAEMNDEETERFSLRTTTVFPQIRKFLNNSQE